MAENNYKDKVNGMPSFEEYAAAREAAYYAEAGENADIFRDNPAQAKKGRRDNYRMEYTMELAARQKNAKAAEDEAERHTREYNEKMAALGAKHRIESSNLDNAYLSILQALHNDEDGNGNASTRIEF